VGALPNKIMLEQILPEWLEMERNIEAFKTGDRSMLLYNVLEDHRTKSYDQAVAVLNDMLAAEGNKELQDYFRSHENATLLA
jgi:alpha-galactosidase/6-phospho-beta-glucosidase family protein